MGYTDGVEDGRDRASLYRRVIGTMRIDSEIGVGADT